MSRAMVLAVVASLGMSSGAFATDPSVKAQCKMFKKTSDGRWYSTITSKVGNPKDFKLLKKGLPIDPALTIQGVNVVASVEKLCGSK